MEYVTISKLKPEELNLLKFAQKAAKNYLNKRTNRRVGAALLCQDGTIYQGASIRRTNVSNSTCAERMALDRAIFDKKYKYKLLAIVGFHNQDKPEEIIPPCGLCRQILAEAESYSESNQPIPILLASSNLSNIIKTDSRKLFPMPYIGKEK